MIVHSADVQQKDDLSANSEFRKALENNESIQKFLPDHVSESEIMALFNSI